MTVPSKPVANELNGEQFRQLVESAPVPFLVVAPDLTIVAITDEYLSATMTRREDLVGHKISEVFPGDLAGAHASREHSAGQSEREFRELADAIPQLAWIARGDGWIYWYNRRWYEYTGTTPAAMEGWGWEAVHDPESLPAVLERWRSSIETGQPFDMVFPLRGAGGKFRPFLTRVTPVKDESGQVMRWFGTNTDISEQVAAEAKRRQELEEHYRLLVETMQDYAIFTLDETGAITTWNPGAARLKGYATNEIVGRNFACFYTEADKQNDLPAKILRTALESGHYEGEGWRVRKDGSRFWASVVVTPLKSENSALRGFSKIVRDMTDRKLLMDELGEHAKELELRIAERDRINADLEAFSYSVAHDLRAPLRTIEGFTSAVLDDFEDQLPAEAREYLQRVVASSERMDRLISDLLQYSRITRAEIALSRVEVQTAVNEALQQLDREARQMVSLNVEASLAVMAHQPTLVQVLTNLISNALKFYPANATPHAEIKAFSKGESVAIQVRDEGIGIESQHLVKIFGTFERLHSTEQYPGTGIGLAIVERGVAKMGGRVRVESTPGRGSIFTIEARTA